MLKYVIMLEIIRITGFFKKKERKGMQTQNQKESKKGN